MSSRFIHTAARTLVALAATLTTAVAGAQQTPRDVSHIYQYTPGDGGIIYSMTRGNRWAIINLGTSASGGDAQSQLFDMDTGQHFPVTYQGRTLPFAMASADGNVVVGHMGEYAITYNRATGVMHSYPNRPLWKGGQLVDVTPDGRLAVGYYEGYLGRSDNQDLPNDWFYRTLLVDVEKGDTLYTPNLPTRDRNGAPLQSIKFSSITPDGRYITGAVDWYLGTGYNFIYDLQQQRTLQGTSLMQLYGGDVASRYPHVQSCQGSMLSPSGNAIGGSAHIVRDNGEVASVPCVYFRDRDSLAVYPDAEEGAVNICDMDDAGTFFGITETGTPLRNFKILYDGKFWVTLNQICRQRYGYNFYERTGYERTGTLMGVSGDGHRLISFHDPMGESYCFDFGMSVEQACAGLDLLGTYTATPEAGSQFAKLGSVEIRFERPVQILGTGRNVHLVDSQGRTVASGLTSSSGLTHKTGSTTTVVANFRPRLLNAGEHYTVVLDSGAVATAVDRERVNRQIEIPYTGREYVPVTMTRATPQDDATLPRLDNISSYILLSFDCRVQLTEGARAYVQRAEDGSTAATLQMVAGTDDNTKHQLLLYPTTAINLFAGHDYRIIVEEGSITDYTGDESSRNQRLELTYHGSYVRTVPTGDVIFHDSWDDISESLQTWLRYEGDHHTPLASMQAWEFDADNQPWNFSIRESETSYDYCAASHSMYAPSDRSNDWMMTPQLSLPAQGRCTLEFDAQGYMSTRQDTLEVYVYEQEWVLSYLSDEWMQDIQRDAQLVLKEIVSPGATQENLSGEWTHYTVDLSPWQGRDVYIAFVNRNRNQSAIFVDNVTVQREVLYQLAFDYEDRVLARTEMPISGHITVQQQADSIALVLRDATGAELSRQQWHGISGDVQGRAIPFRFQQPLPLHVGEVNPYSIDVQVNQRHDTYQGSITDLAFMPTRRVVLEEMTGIDCPNCPLGIATISRLRQAFGDRFIPISLHTYTADPYESGMSAYAQFLGLNAAPSGRINRMPGIYYPMVSTGTEYHWTYPSDPLWYDVVSQQMNEPALCDLSVTATRQADEVEFTAAVQYAITAADQQLSLLFVMLEDSLVNYQANAFGSIESPALGEWGAGGIMSGQNTGGYVYPAVHDDVARSVVGTTLGGTIGLLPSQLQWGQTYTATVRAAMPTNLLDARHAHVVAMLIDAHSGQIVNAAHTRLTDIQDAIADVPAANTPTGDVYSPSGTLLMRHATAADLQRLPHGIYIVGGRKYFKL